MRRSLPLAFLALLTTLAAPGVGAQTPGTCAPATATTDLHANSVRARLYNNGGLFWKGAGNVYNVPAAPEGAPITPNAVFAAGLWVGGRVGGEVRQAAATYGNWEFWPGPLGTNGAPPADCAPFDRIYRITSADVRAYERAGTVSADLAAWPVALGAGVLDGDGVAGNYNLAGGDRPELLGHEAHFWVMNDVGNVHARTGSKPIGLEVRVTAFAASSDDAAIDQATLYRYALVNRSPLPLTDALVGFWTDVDLGDASDDYVGSDTALGMVYGYNSDNNDEGSEGYGPAPPAFGVTLLPDGGVRERPYTLQTLYKNLGNHGEPQANTDQFYKRLQALGHDGSPMYGCGNGTTNQEPQYACAVTRYMFTGDPVAGTGWTMRTPGGPMMDSLSPFDVRMLLSAGPYTLEPGATRTLTFALVWARGTSNLDSVTRLREAARTVERAWTQSGFRGLTPLAAVAAAPAAISPADGVPGQPDALTFTWGAVPNARRYALELSASPGFEEGQTVRLAASGLSLDVNLASLALPSSGPLFWRVRGGNTASEGPWSAANAFGRAGRALVAEVGFRTFLVTANANGPLAPPEFGALDPNHRGFPRTGEEAAFDATAASQVGPGTFGLHTLDTDAADGGFAYFDARVTRDGANLPAIGTSDYEWRFTGSSVAYNAFQDGATYAVPFELWDTGTKPDASDDVRLIPYVMEHVDAAVAGREAPNRAFDVGPDHPTSGGTNDPQTDAVFWMRPADASPGQAGYQAYVADVQGARTLAPVGAEVFAHTVLVNFNGGPQWSGPFNQALPEAGTIFRIELTDNVFDAPVRSAPADGVVYWRAPKDVELFWQGPPETIRYDIELASNAPGAPVIRDSTSGTLYRAAALGYGTYTWRVRARHASGVLSPWSTAGAFTVAGLGSGEGETGLPGAVTLSAAYPNPFASATAVRYGLPVPGRVRLAAYDVLGRRVAVLADGEEGAGWHTASFDASALAAGVYVLRLEAGGRVEARTVVRVR